jgi:hypothetical protein
MMKSGSGKSLPSVGCDHRLHGQGEGPCSRGEPIVTSILRPQRMDRDHPCESRKICMGDRRADVELRGSPLPNLQWDGERCEQQGDSLRLTTLTSAGWPLTRRPSTTTPTAPSDATTGRGRSMRGAVRERRLPAHTHDCDGGPHGHYPRILKEGARIGTVRRLAVLADRLLVLSHGGDAAPTLIRTGCPGSGVRPCRRPHADDWPIVPRRPDPHRVRRPNLHGSPLHQAWASRPQGRGLRRANGRAQALGSVATESDKVWVAQPATCRRKCEGDARRSRNRRAGLPWVTSIAWALSPARPLRRQGPTPSLPLPRPGGAPCSVWRPVGDQPRKGHARGTYNLDILKDRNACRAGARSAVCCHPRPGDRDLRRAGRRLRQLSSAT